MIINFILINVCQMLVVKKVVVCIQVHHHHLKHLKLSATTIKAITTTTITKQTTPALTTTIKISRNQIAAIITNQAISVPPIVMIQVLYVVNVLQDQIHQLSKVPKVVENVKIHLDILYPS